MWNLHIVDTVAVYTHNYGTSKKYSPTESRRLHLKTRSLWKSDFFKLNSILKLKGIVQNKI